MATGTGAQIHESINKARTHHISDRRIEPENEESALMEHKTSKFPIMRAERH